jgi:hypothetical protein
MNNLIRKTLILVFVLIGQNIYSKIPDLKHRAGIDINYGLGFNKINLFQTQEGKDIALKTGGGVAFGAKYGLEMDGKYDLAVDLLYQHSSLDKKLDNANASFNRILFSLTPSYIFEIDKMNGIKVRTGAGLSIYMGNKIIIDETKLNNGEKQTLKYKTAFGPHVSATCEIRIYKHINAFAGIKMYYVKYKFNKSGSTHDYSVDPIMNEVKGSGADFMLGACYNF